MHTSDFKNKRSNDLNDLGKSHEETDNSVNVERISEDNVNYFYILMQSIQNLRFAVANDEDGGIRVCLSVLSALPQDIRDLFSSELKTVRGILRSEAYNHTIKIDPITKQKKIVVICTLVIGQYRILVSDVLGKLIDVLKKKNWLFKTKSELMGGE